MVLLTSFKGEPCSITKGPTNTAYQRTDNHDVRMNYVQQHGTEPRSWTLIDSHLPVTKPDLQFWWEKSGLPYAVLLQQAGYSIDSQIQELLFFYSYVIQELGPGPDSQGRPQRWKSFMTDHFSPIEFSWEWGHGSGDSTIRFSIEPIGPFAGSSADPLNHDATTRLAHQYQRLLPYCDLTLFHHFSDKLLSYEHVSARQGHESRTFLAFDPRKDRKTLKAYFLPAFKAAEVGKPTWDVILDAIQSLPGYSNSVFPGLLVLQDFLSNNIQDPALVAELFAIDCVAPPQSRLKIYMRSTATHFGSVRNIMTLGGIYEDSDLDRGVGELRKLWNLVFSPDPEMTEDEQLKANRHRTAGILYYFEIMPTNGRPNVKIYLPVRHYGHNDLSIAEGLKTYLEGRGQLASACGYLKALKAVARGSSPQRRCGTQTYIGCSFVRGELKLTSYLAPEVYNV